MHQPKQGEPTDIVTLKIGSLTPNSKHFSLTFEINQQLKRSPDSLYCRIVDDTGIVNARFDKHVDKLVTGQTFQMNELKCKVVAGYIQLVNTPKTAITKQALIFEFKDKTNDISKKFYAPKHQVQKISQNNKQPASQHKKQKKQGVIVEQKKTDQSLIPLTKEQYQKELKLKKEFQDNMRKKYGKEEKQANQKAESSPAKRYREKQQKHKEKKEKQNPPHSKGDPSKTKYKQKEKPIVNVKVQKKTYKPKENEEAKEEQNSNQQTGIHQSKDTNHQINKQKRSLKEEEPQKSKPQDKKEEEPQKSKPQDQKEDQAQKSKPQDKKEEEPQKSKPQDQKEDQAQKSKPQDKKEEEPQKSKPQDQKEDQAQKSKPQDKKEEEPQKSKPQERKESGQFSNTGQFSSVKSVVNHINSHVNLKVYVSANKMNENQKQYERFVADSTGSVLVRFFGQNVMPDGDKWYELDNLQVCKDDKVGIILKQTEFSEARITQPNENFNLKPISLQ